MQRGFVSGEICGSKIIWKVATSDYCGTFSSYCKIGPVIHQRNVLTLHGKMPWEVFPLIFDFLTPLLSFFNNGHFWSPIKRRYKTLNMHLSYFPCPFIQLFCQNCCILKLSSVKRCVWCQKSLKYFFGLLLLQ